MLMTVLGKSKGQDVRSLLLRAGLSMEGHEAGSWGSPSSALVERLDSASHGLWS